MFKHEWVWDKHIPRGFQVAKYRPMRKHEDVLVFSKEKVRYFPINVLRDKPVTVKNYATDKDASIGKYNDINKKFTYTHKSPDTIITGCWEANAGKLHPTQKPVSLFEYLIKTYTKEGEIVLDNCCGSGTTGVACKNTNRNFIQIEQSQEYVKIAEERLKNSDQPLPEATEQPKTTTSSQDNVKVEELLVQVPKKRGRPKREKTV